MLVHENSLYCTVEYCSSFCSCDRSEKNERWSFAMRCLLALLKWMIAWIVARQQPSTVPGEQP